MNVPVRMHSPHFRCIASEIPKPALLRPRFSTPSGCMGIFLDRNIIVTGASRGIGAGIVRHLAAEGAKVGFSYAHNPDLADQVLRELPGQGHFKFHMNIAQPESIEKGIAEVLTKFLKVDGLVNNAGVTKDNLFVRMKLEDFQSVINTNLTGIFLVTQALLKTFMKQRSGSIVNISSVVAHSGNPGQANYCASKGGLEAMTRSLAQEVASRGIRVNAVAPGFIQTDMTHELPAAVQEQLLKKIPLQRMGSAEEIAHAVAFLLSEQSSYITGHSLHVNGGMWMN